jgi:hypothetical protein
MLNEAAGLPRVLRSLAALEPPPAEVLAVDGGSADASVAIADGRAACRPARDPWWGGVDQPWRAGSHGTDHLRPATPTPLLPDDAVAVMRRVLADPGTALARFTPLLSGPDQVRWGTSFHNWIKPGTRHFCSGRNSSCAACGCYSATTPCSLRSCLK